MAAAAGAALALALGALGFLAHVAGWLKSAVHYLVTAPRFNPVGFGGLLSRLSVFLGLREAAPAPPLGGFLEALLDWAGRFSFSSPPPPGIGAGVAGAALESATRRLFSASPRILAEEVRAAGRVVQSRSFICPTCQNSALQLRYTRSCGRPRVTCSFARLVGRVVRPITLMIVHSTDLRRATTEVSIGIPCGFYTVGHLVGREA